MSKNRHGLERPQVKHGAPALISLGFALLAMLAHYLVSGPSQIDIHTIGTFVVTGFIMFGLVYMVAFSAVNRQIMEEYEARKANRS